MTAAPSAGGTTNPAVPEPPKSEADTVQTPIQSPVDAPPESSQTDRDSTSTQTLTRTTGTTTIWAGIITLTGATNDGAGEDAIPTTASNGQDTVHDPGQTHLNGWAPIISSQFIDSSLEGAATTAAPFGPPSPYLRPEPLDNGGGVVVLSETLSLNEALTVGDGPSRTTLSLRTQEEGTLLMYGTSAAALVSDTRPRHSFAGHTVEHLSGSAFLLGSQTIAPGSTVTVGTGSGEATYSMFESKGATCLADETDTVKCGPDPSGRPSVDLDDLAFTRASNGNFVLDGTTLEPGEAITVGSGRDRTTVAMTSLQSAPAIVIDGTMTAQLSGFPNAMNSSSSSTSLPAVTGGSEPGYTKSVPTTATSASPSENVAASTGNVALAFLMLLGAVVIALHLP